MRQNINCCLVVKVIEIEVSIQTCRFLQFVFMCSPNVFRWLVRQSDLFEATSCKHNSQTFKTSLKRRLNWIMLLQLVNKFSKSTALCLLLNVRFSSYMLTQFNFVIKFETLKWEALQWKQIFVYPNVCFSFTLPTTC